MKTPSPTETYAAFTASMALVIPDGTDLVKLHDDIMDAVIAVVEAVGGEIGGGSQVCPTDANGTPIAPPPAALTTEERIDRLLRRGG